MDEEVDSVEEATEVRSFFSSALQGPPLRLVWSGATFTRGDELARRQEGQGS